MFKIELLTQIPLLLWHKYRNENQRFEHRLIVQSRDWKSDNGCRKKNTFKVYY